MTRAIALNDNTIGGLWAARLRKVKPHRVMLRDCTGQTIELPQAKIYSRFKELLNNGTIEEFTAYDHNGMPILHQTFRQTADRIPPAAIVVNAAPAAGAAPAGGAAAAPAGGAAPAAGMRASGPGQQWTRPVASGDNPAWLDAMAATSELQLRVAELQAHNVTTLLDPIRDAYKIALDAQGQVIAAQQQTIRDLTRTNSMLRHELAARPWIETPTVDDTDDSVGGTVGKVMGQVAMAALEHIGAAAETKS